MAHPSDASFVAATVDGSIATITLQRGKVNALIPEVLSQLQDAIQGVRDAGARAVVFTGNDKFFSFGFDVPHMRSWPRQQFGAFIHSFCTLYRDIFLLPVPVVAALRGHTVAGGCMLAMAADVRVMARDSAKISLNEITFGAGVFAGLVEMLRAQVSGRVAAKILYEGAMYRGDEALADGLVDQVLERDDVLPAARACAERLSRNVDAFASIKRLLRDSVGERMAALEAQSIERWLDLWYSEDTQRQITGIEIR